MLLKHSSLTVLMMYFYDVKNLIFIFFSDAKSGMYFLKQGSGAEKAYCYMKKLCGEKGWTMILKADGHKVKNIKPK